VSAWFDQASATLGGRDVVETVRELLGNVSRFDFQQVGKDLPRVDLPDLEKFFTQTVSRHGRRIFRREGGLEIKTPDEWKTRSYALRDKYEGLVFDRSLRGTNAASRVLGVGHLLFDIALEEARNLPSSFARADGLAAPLLVVTVEDEVTGTGALVHRLIFGVTERDGEAEVLRDWELLQLLNAVALKSAGRPAESDPSVVERSSVIARLKQAFDGDLLAWAPTLRRPVSRPEILLLPVGQR
jgi:hypothetical protein